MTSILWLRRDLRLHDLPALLAAHEASGDGTVLPVFVADPTLLASSGPVRVRCLVEALTEARDAYDGALVVRHGRPEDVVPALAREVGATGVHVSGETTPYGRARDARVEAAMPDGVPLVATGSPYAVAPGRLHTAAGSGYAVFTPFSRAWREQGWHRPADVPADVRWYRGPESEPLPGIPAEARDVDLPPVGERAAHAAWTAFLADGLATYKDDRNRADLNRTSAMSVQLKYGTVHPRTLLADLAAHPLADGEGAATYTTELCWREFYADVLWRRPDSARRDLTDTLRGMVYDEPGPTFDAWREGRTGYPFVDAGMRQLLREGWVHNRVRMVVASFLVKDLHVRWQHGAAHFLRHLRDGDVASNAHGWQWVAGTGTDPSPYFRVFNPVVQGEKFDPDGDYVRRYVPELAHLPGAAVHQPWRVLDGYAGGYPERVVDHGAERAEALARYAAVREG
ncbi:cryptochrome/photolyase family protein [Cellulomonas aerilata]|uniref:Deoxyribodipyrimidine photo-lyase n=1 Tax=Cellulomonas aerilata TaxID=515326 RepID=A0A512D9S5_9CELL|nr:deoxyribodipyrimidine photo-lyase [Cellulomonas aerilata]GEO33219.1 deoxyribodipyrimidine photo-lyase [Cellulomonas aerilata]